MFEGGGSALKIIFLLNFLDFFHYSYVGLYQNNVYVFRTCSEHRYAESF